MVDKQQLAAMGEHMREMEECKPNFKVPHGWRLVPAKMTDAMGDAIYKELGSPTDGWYGFDDAYRAMLAAAPSPDSAK